MKHVLLSFTLYTCDMHCCSSMKRTAQPLRIAVGSVATAATTALAQRWAAAISVLARGNEFNGQQCMPAG